MFACETNDEEFFSCSVRVIEPVEYVGTMKETLPSHSESIAEFSALFERFVGPFAISRVVHCKVLKLTSVWPELVKRMILMYSNLCEVKVIFVTLGL